MLRDIYKWMQQNVPEFNDDHPKVYVFTKLYMSFGMLSFPNRNNKKKTNKIFTQAYRMLISQFFASYKSRRRTVLSSTKIIMAFQLLSQYKHIFNIGQTTESGLCGSSASRGESVDQAVVIKLAITEIEKLTRKMVMENKTLTMFEHSQVCYWEDVRFLCPRSVSESKLV